MRINRNSAPLAALLSAGVHANHSVPEYFVGGDREFTVDGNTLTIKGIRYDIVSTIVSYDGDDMLSEYLLVDETGNVAHIDCSENLGFTHMTYDAEIDADQLARFAKVANDARRNEITLRPVEPLLFDLVATELVTA